MLPRAAASRALLTLLVAAALASAPAPAGAEPPVETRVLTRLATGNEAIGEVGTNRGRGMERESLGITLAAGATIEARVVNGVSDVTLSLLTANHETDVESPGSAGLPAGGAWRTVTAVADSAVLVRARPWATAPVVEFRVRSGTARTLPEFRAGDDHGTFVAAWEASGAPFALVVGEAFQMLLPRVDLPRLRTMTGSQFEDLGDVVAAYEELIATYDRWLGLDDADPSPAHRPLAHSYFIRPDAHGWGLAYYSGGNYVGTSSGSVAPYFESPSSWLILHEIGHGYDGLMTTPQDPGDVALGEVWNNVYAYAYQTRRHGLRDANWLNGDGKAAGQRTRDEARRAAGRLDYADLDHRNRLDVMARILERTGLEGFRGFNRRVRELRTDGASGVGRRTDLIAMQWGAPAGYNLVPWLAAHSLEVAPTTAQWLFDVARLPIALPASDSFADPGRAELVAAAQGLEAPGDLAIPAELAGSGATGGLTVAVTGAPGVEGRLATLWDGQRLVARAAFEAGLAVFPAAPVGAYTLRLPEDPGTGYVPERRAVTIREMARPTTVGIDYPVTAPVPVAGSRLSLLGLGDAGFVTLTHDRAAATLVIADNLAAPHSYFADEYARITVDAGPTRLFDRSFVGDRPRPGQPRSVSVPAEPGTTITITHREAGTRLVPTDPATGEPKPSLASGAVSTTYLVTEWGLARADDPGRAQSEFGAALRRELGRLDGLAASHPEARLEATAAGLRAGIRALASATEREALGRTYGALLARLIAPATAALPPAPTPSQSPSPSTSPSTSPSISPTPGPVDVYSTPGFHLVNGREWLTACEPYSRTTRCRTTIWATRVTSVGGRFTSSRGWVFNNLTYLPGMTRAQWAGNPLATTGTWTAQGGRRWRTECDTPTTGRNGCRSYVVATVIEARPGPGGGHVYAFATREVFNNIVRFR